MDKLGEFVKNLFGGKSWYKSITAWGIVLWAAIGPAVDAACAPDVALLNAATCGALGGMIAKVGWALTALGIRRAATAPNTA